MKANMADYKNGNKTYSPYTILFRFHFSIMKCTRELQRARFPIFYPEKKEPQNPAEHFNSASLIQKITKPK
jgi:hypothetical protein